jgi:hypothetical protein
VRADSDEDGVEAALGLLGDEVRDAVAGGDHDPEAREAVDLAGEDVARQAVGGDPVAEHAAGRLAGVADLDLVPEAREVVRGREAARAAADHEHAPAGRRGDPLEGEAALQREVAEEPLDGVDRDARVELAAVAARLARVVADAAVDRRERVVGAEHAPGVLVTAVDDVREPALDVLAGRAGRVAGRQKVDVDGALRALRTGGRRGMGEIGQAGDVARHECSSAGGQGAPSNAMA